MRKAYHQLSVLLHFRTPLPRFFIDDSSWRNAAESFTIALTLILEEYESAIVPNFQQWKILLITFLFFA